MAKKAAVNSTVVIQGTEIGHFEDEVFSWHGINGVDAEDCLPAILITNTHPLILEIEDLDLNGFTG